MELVKFSLIDLETQRWVTGGKQAKAVQPERLSEKTANNGCDSLNTNITKEVSEFESKNSDRQKWSVGESRSNRMVHFAGRASDKEIGLSMRVVRQYTINNDSIPTRLDVLYGWAPLYPELACRVAA